MADPILPPTLAALLQQSLTPERQRELTMAAALRNGMLNPDASTGPLGGPEQGPMPPTLSGVENRAPLDMAAMLQANPAPQGPSPPRNALSPQTPQEEADLAESGRWAGAFANATGAGPAVRSMRAAQEGRPLEAVGNAAVAAIPFKPAAGLGALGATYGAALASDLLPGMFGTPSAEAQQGASDPMAADRKMLENLVGQQATLRAQAEAARQRMESERASGTGPKFNAAKQAYEAANARADAMDKQVSALNKRTSPEAVQQHGEYSRAVEAAERGLAEARSSRVRPFKDTNVGELYEATGGWTPAVAGAGTSALLRSVGHGRRAAVAEGAAAGAVTPNAPLIWDMFAQPTYNPERKMYSDYARDLPATHPRRQEWTDYANRQPEENPTRRLAVEEFYNPFKIGERLGVGALEGGVGGSFGAGLAEGARRIGSSARSGLDRMLGRRQGTQNQQQQGPTLDERRRDPSFRMDPAAPAAAGEIETWVSPQGRNIWTRDANGRFRDERGQLRGDPRTERRSWRRISSADDAGQPSSMSQFLMG